MGIHSRCICPDILEQFINDWFFIYTVNDGEAFLMFNGNWLMSESTISWSGDLWLI